MESLAWPLPTPHCFTVRDCVFVGGEAVLCHGWCRTTVHQRRDPPHVLQTFLEPEDGPGQTKL